MENRFRLYIGLMRGGKWYNHTEVHPLKGGTLEMLDTGDKTGAVRFLKLIKGSIDTLYTEDGDSLTLQSSDYGKLTLEDAWKIGYEQIKVTTGEDYPIIPENFYCPRCSKTNDEKYTSVNESWQKLIDDVLIDEIYLRDKMDSEEGCFYYPVKLVEPMEIESGRTIVGGTFNTIIRRPLTLEDMITIQKNPNALSTEANTIFACWDASILKVEGMSKQDLNILKRIPDIFFTKKYLSPRNYQIMDDSFVENTFGISAKDRKVSCYNCGEEIGGYLDQTNFFLPLLPKKSTRSPL